VRGERVRGLGLSKFLGLKNGRMGLERGGSRGDRSVVSDEVFWLGQLREFVGGSRGLTAIRNRMAVNLECSVTNLFSILLNTEENPGWNEYLTKRDYVKLLENFGLSYDTLEVELSFKEIDLDGDGLIYCSDFANFIKPNIQILKDINKCRRQLKSLDEISLIS
jgi:hypothetical protein